MKVRAQLIELYKKYTPFKTKEKVYWNGENNNYSQEIERAIFNSATGSRAKEMFSRFIFGSGIEIEKDIVLKNGRRLSEIAKDVIDDVVVQNGSFIHVTYKIEIDGTDVLFVPDIPKSLDYHKCRITTEDDNGNDGFILYKSFDRSDKDLTKKEKDYEKKYYPFSLKQEVIKAQIKADAKKEGIDTDKGDWSEMIKHYSGQVLYMNLTPKFRYAISKFDSVYNDLDTEYRISVYTNGMSRGGFLGKTAVLTQGLDTEKEDDIKDDIKNWLGAENSSGVYNLNVEQAESLDNVLKIIQVDSQLDYEQFKELKEDIRLNILGAANNLPQELAFNSGGVFDSGEKYTQAKNFYWEQCEFERQKIEKLFKKLGYDISFKPFKNELEDGNNISSK